jgi:hypothetical protein
MNPLELEEIEETDEIIDQQEEMVKARPFKEPKRKPALLKGEKTNFHSGEYYKTKDLQKKLEEKIMLDVEAQSDELEGRVKPGEKKSILSTEKDKAV